MRRFVVIENYQIQKPSEISSMVNSCCDFCGSSSVVGLGDEDMGLTYCLCCHTAYDDLFLVSPDDLVNPVVSRAIFKD